MSEQLARKVIEPIRTTRFQSLQPGQFWRATQDIPTDEIPLGQVLLIMDIRYIEDTMHAVVLRGHPDRFVKKGHGVRHEFLVKEFLNKFEFEPDGEAIRQREIQERQGLVLEAQEELTRLQQEPEAMMNAVLEKMGTEKPEMLLLGEGEGVIGGERIEIHAILSRNDTAELVRGLKDSVERQVQIATLKAEVLKDKLDGLNERMQAILPFILEQGEVAIARTKDVREYVKDLQRGLQTLDLYVGTDVEVVTVKTGPEAPESEKLTILQRKLFVDEELSVFQTVSEWFDFEDIKVFEKALNDHPGLVDQICPAPRCVVLLATLRNGLNYGDARTSAYRNELNREAFLLVRNGENLHLVYSPVSSHKHADALFPSRNKIEKIFQDGFFEPRMLTLDDVAYSERFADWESVALHFRRFLVLLAGLDMRLELFGKFYEENDRLFFVSERFQKRYMRFVHDDDGEGMLPEEDRISFGDWIKSQNRYMRSGSRVLVDFESAMTQANCPGAKWEEQWGSKNWEPRYTPVVPVGVVVSYQRKNQLFVDMAVEGKTNDYKDREFNCRLDLSLEDHPTGSVLCLDRARLKDLVGYIQDRRSRSLFRNYMVLFKAAVKYLREQAKQEQEIRRELENSLLAGNVVASSRVPECIEETIALWRAGNRGASLPTLLEARKTAIWNELLDLAWTVARRNSIPTDLILSKAVEMGITVLRIVSGKGGHLALYAVPGPGEGDRGFLPNIWCRRIPVSVLRNGKVRIGKVAEGTAGDGGKWSVLHEAVPDEMVLVETDQASQWVRKEAPPCKATELFHCFEICDSFVSDLSGFLLNDGLELFSSLWDEAVSFRKQINRKGRFVQSGKIYFPFGLQYSKWHNQIFFLALAMDLNTFVYLVAPNESTRLKVADWHASLYQQREAQLAAIQEACLESDAFEFLRVRALPTVLKPMFFHSSLSEAFSISGVDRSRKNERLAKWIKEKTKETKGSDKFWFHPSIQSPNGTGTEFVIDELLESLITGRRRLLSEA